MSTAWPERDDIEDLVQLATFLIGDEEYAIDIMRIKEIINPLRITKVPKAPSFVEGVIELRGAIVPVIDLRKRFELAAEPIGRAGKYVIVTLAGRVVGLIVDAVREVLRVRKAEVRPAPEFGTGGVDASFFSGVCHVRERIIMILELGKVLTQKERQELGGAEGETA